MDHPRRRFPAALPRETAIAPARRAAVYGGILLVCLTLAAFAGKDLNWDLLNYHVYAGYMVLDGSVRDGYFAASVQTYLNPYAHVPLYWMIKHGVAPFAIGMLLAAFHALNLFFVFEIAVLLNGRRDGKIAWWAVGLAMFFALANPIFLQELGSSFTEISTGAFVLAGWYGLFRAYRSPSLPLVALSGLLIGMGIAFKMTNALFSVTALPLILLLPMGMRWRCAAVLAFALGGIAGVAAGGGWWMWQLWQEFRNPLFPMFNNIFASPDFVPAAIKNYRFLPTSLGDALLMPWHIMVPDANVYTESTAPDARYLALLLLPVLYAGKAVLAKGRQPLLEAFEQQRALVGLALAFLLAWTAWLAMSANGRYFLPMSLLAAVLLASLVARLSVHPRSLWYVGLVLVAVQAVQVVIGTDTRWVAAPWGERWIDLEVPPDLQQRPTLHLVVSAESASFMLPSLAAGSELIDITGQFGIARNQRVQDLLDRHAGRVRAMRWDLAGPGSALAVMDFYLVHLGLQVDRSDCKTIRYHRIRAGASAALPDYHDYLSCATTPLNWSAAQWASYEHVKQQADRVFNQLEDLCPTYFSPGRVLSEGNGKSFVRHYMNTDSQLSLGANGKVSYRNGFRNQPDQTIGRLQDLLATPARAQQVCPPGRPLHSR